MNNSSPTFVRASNEIVVIRSMTRSRLAIRGAVKSIPIARFTVSLERRFQVR